MRVRLQEKQTLKSTFPAAETDPKQTVKFVMPAPSRHPLPTAGALPGLRPADYGKDLVIDSGFRRNDGLWPKIAARQGFVNVRLRESKP